MTWKEALEINTFPDEILRANDVWDEAFNCNYSADGQYLLEAEAFPSEVVVRAGTQIICDDAFAYQDYMDDENEASYLEKIDLPEGLTHIGEGAFDGCAYLRSVRLPKTLVSIGGGAFAFCASLKTVSCPQSLRVIGPDAFCECYELRKVQLNAGLEAIGKGAFSQCDALREIRVPVGMLSRFKAMIPKSLHRYLREGR